MKKKKYYFVCLLLLTICMIQCAATVQFILYCFGVGGGILSSCLIYANATLPGLCVCSLYKKKKKSIP